MEPQHTTLDHAGAWVALIVGVLSIVVTTGSGLWFLARLSASVAHLVERFDEFRTEVGEDLRWTKTQIAKLHTASARLEQRAEALEREGP